MGLGAQPAVGQPARAVQPGVEASSESLVGSMIPNGAPTAEVRAQRAEVMSHQGEVPEAPSPGPQILGRGATARLSAGTTEPRNLREQLAIEEALANAENGEHLPIRMADTRWPADQGWKKVEHQVQTRPAEPRPKDFKKDMPDIDNGRVNVHHVRNSDTGELDDPKVVLPGPRAGTQWDPTFPGVPVTGTPQEQQANVARERALEALDRRAFPERFETADQEKQIAADQAREEKEARRRAAGGGRGGGGSGGTGGGSGGTTGSTGSAPP